jgi:flagellar biosynthesis protein FlhF
VVLSNRVTPTAWKSSRRWKARRGARAPCAVTAPAPPLQPPHPPRPASPPDSPAEGDAVLREIHSMRGMIEEQLAGMAWNDKQRRDPVRGHLLRTLLGAGFSARLAKDSPAGPAHRPEPRAGMDYAKAELARRMPLLEDEDALMDEGGVYALMGPTGVGKTTTTAKLAARCVMRFGADKLALVTTDSYRIGAYEQLRIYGQILGVSVHAVKDAADLDRVLAGLRDKHMVLIDTVGMSQRDRAVSEQIAMLCGANRPVKRLLLLNASSHGDTLNEVVRAYRHGDHADSGWDLAGCIFTKVDESTHPGALIDMAIRHQLPVHYISSGQKVPEHLVLADGKALVDSVFQAEKPQCAVCARRVRPRRKCRTDGDAEARWPPLPKAGGQRAPARAMPAIDPGAHAQRAGACRQRGRAVAGRHRL